jgi:predicted TIM-barrel fold metal-dependent hydrolase
MYAVDHIRRVLETFPGVFSGIGEFTIHKEFVSSKVAGDTASLTDPAVDRILDFAAETGLVVILHCDIDMPFAKVNQEPVFLSQMKSLLRRHPKTAIIWAHTGLGRVVHPVQSQAVAGHPVTNPNHLQIVEALLADPTLKHVYFDISWDEVAKYAVATAETRQATAAVFERYPDRFLFGTDNVAPADQAAQLRVFHLWDDIFANLTPAASLAVRRGNYERLFDTARTRVRAWEAANVRPVASPGR